VPTKARSFPLPGTGNQSRVSSLILHLKDSSPGFENCGLQIYDLKGRGEIDNCKLSEATSLRGDPGSSCQSPGLGCNKQEIFLVVWIFSFTVCWGHFRDTASCLDKSC
jgi:hypothetical protein